VPVDIAHNPGNFFLDKQKAFSENGVEVTPIQVMLLFFLQKNDGSSLTQISQGLMPENPTVTGLIDRLEKLGYVKRSDHPNKKIRDISQFFPATFRSFLSKPILTSNYRTFS